ncbi:MAG: hypothetical protein B6D41_00495 [Chloroflexi bacterium UTCFX4]|jgi:uncharacterized membrane protein YidH (DUF202 family)|nr:MAG: hypothetical protein B6D41_00495 [Chloroflexi bacterium UTCFX4]
MSSVLLELIPLMVVAALEPFAIIVFLMLMRSASRVLNGASFVGGMIVVRLTQGILFGILFSASAEAQTEDGSKSIVHILLVVIGIILLISAYKKWQKEEDPDAPPPKWMAMFGSLSALKAFGFGIVFMLVVIKQWVFTLGALSIINQAHLSSPDNAIAYLIFILGAQSLLIAKVIASAAAPAQSSRFFQTAGQWMERNNRPIMIGVSLVFGVYLSFKGITGLLGS